MPKVTVYRVKSYDMQTDKYITSKRMATVHGAKTMGGEIIGSSGVDIDESELEAGFEWTPIDFVPRNPRQP